MNETPKKEMKETPRRILENAGRLFAEHGYEATSTRMISDACGILPSLIHYHFGSKMNLYTEVFSMLVESENDIRTESIIKEHPEWKDKPEGHAKILQRRVYAMFENIKSEKYPWKADLFFREFCMPSPAKQMLITRIHRPLIEDFMRFCKITRPDFTENHLRFLAFLPVAQVNFYLAVRNSKNSVYSNTQQESLLDADELLKDIAKYTVITMLEHLDLPFPDDLREFAPYIKQRRDK